MGMTMPDDWFEEEINTLEKHVDKGLQRHSETPTAYSQPFLTFLNSVKGYIDAWRLSKDKESVDK
jgi:hypothetical protein